MESGTAAGCGSGHIEARPAMNQLNSEVHRVARCDGIVAEFHRES